MNKKWNSPLSVINRNSHRRCSLRKDFLRNFAKFTENTCARVSFLIKFQASGNDWIQASGRLLLYSDQGWGDYLKVVSATFLLVCFLSLKESTNETSKNIFFLNSKALFALEKIKV